MLSQDCAEGRGKRPVAFFSRKLTATEHNYDTTNRELLAVLQCVKRWRPYLHGRRFKLYTDHEPLLSLHMQPGLSPRRLRWLEQLQEFDIAFVHVPGRDNVVPDTLSRPPVDSADLHDVAEPHVQSELRKWLALVAPDATLADVTAAATQSLAAGRTVCAIRCPHCTHLHVDEDAYAARKHVTHLC